MKENFPIQPPPEESVAEKTDAFFSDRFKKITGEVLMGFGGILGLATIYEFLTGHQVNHLVAEYSDKLPGLANYLIDNLSHMPLVLKGGGGLASMQTGQRLIESISTPNEEKGDTKE